MATREGESDMSLKIEVSRSKWDRGKWHGELYNRRTGEMCILGYVGVACGIKLEDMNGEISPFSMFLIDKPWPRWILDDFRNGGTKTRRIVSVNDGKRIRGTARESRLKWLLKKHDIHVTFVD